RREATRASVSRSSKATAPAHASNAPSHQSNGASLLRRTWISRARDSIHGEVHARRRAKLPRSFAHVCGKILRARGESAAFQATLHGRGLRSLLPDREVFPR